MFLGGIACFRLLGSLLGWLRRLWPVSLLKLLVFRANLSFALKETATFPLANSQEAFLPPLSHDFLIEYIF